MKFSISSLGTKARTLTALCASVVVVGIGASPNAALATPLTWTVDGAFADGGIISGSFTYDADTDSMSAWSLTVAGGNVASFPTFTYSNSVANSFINFTTTDDRFIFCGNVNCDNGSRELRLAFAASLSDAGGTVAMLAGIADPTPPGFGFECYNCSPFRLITSGSAHAGTPTAVPEPGTLALFGLALGGIAVFRSRRSLATRSFR